MTPSEPQTTTTRGTVINIHGHGALVRLEDGTLAAVGAAEVAANRNVYVASLQKRAALDLVLERSGRHVLVRSVGSAAPAAPPAASVLGTDDAFEERIDAYLKETEAWAPADRPPPAERHFIRKKRRAALFEARNKPT